MGAGEVRASESAAVRDRRKRRHVIGKLGTVEGGAFGRRAERAEREANAGKRAA